MQGRARLTKKFFSQLVTVMEIALRCLKCFLIPIRKIPSTLRLLFKCFVYVRIWIQRKPNSMYQKQLPFPQRNSLKQSYAPSTAYAPIAMRCDHPLRPLASSSSSFASSSSNPSL